MTNGDIIKHVRELLQDPDSMTVKTAQSMTLTLLAELYDRWTLDHERIETLWKERETNLGDHDKISKMFPVHQLGIWVGGLFFAADIALIWGILTHSIELMRP